MSDARRGCAIVGIGQTEFSREGAESETSLALRAIRLALEDAGLKERDIDGMVVLDQEVADEWVVGDNLGIENVTYAVELRGGGGACCGLVAAAVAAVGSGQADVVLVYRSIRAYAVRYGSHLEEKYEGKGPFAYMFPFGVVTAPQIYALQARRYMHEFGATSEDFGRVAVGFRQNANRHPTAFMHGRPMTLADHQASRMICDPFRLLDCCLETNFAGAVIVTSLERARGFKQPPVRIAAAAQALGPVPGRSLAMNSASLTTTSSRDLSDTLYEMSGLQPPDIDVAQLYDNFTSHVLIQLEDFGFCGRGEAPAFVAEGNIGYPNGSLPVNTSGGLLSEGYGHGLNLINEAVRQLRGTAVNQVAGAETCLVSGGVGQPTSGMILTKA